MRIKEFKNTGIKDNFTQRHKVH